MIAHYFAYDTEKFNFIKLVEDLLYTHQLELLHETTNEKYDELFKVGDDSKTIFHKRFYDEYRSGWHEMEEAYYQFIKTIIAPAYQGDILYQKFPTVRFHLPNNVAVGDFHNDAEFGHPEGEINYIIPLTDSIGTASVWVESEPGKKDFESLIMKKGTCILFNGNQLTHGNKINDTGKTRVSMDFRVLPLSKYNDKHNKASMTRKTKFVIGEYYKLLKK